MLTSLLLFLQRFNSQANGLGDKLADAVVGSKLLNKLLDVFDELVVDGYASVVTFFRRGVHYTSLVG